MHISFLRVWRAFGPFFAGGLHDEQARARALGPRRVGVVRQSARGVGLEAPAVEQGTRPPIERCARLSATGAQCSVRPLFNPAPNAHAPTPTESCMC